MLVLTGVPPDEGRAYWPKPGTVSSGDKLGPQAFVRFPLVRETPSSVADACGLGGAPKGAGLSLNFPDHLVQSDDRDIHRPLPAGQLDGYFAVDLVHTFAVGHEVGSRKRLGRRETASSPEILDNLAEHLQRDAGLAELSSDSKGYDISERVAPTDPSAFRRDRCGEKTRLLPVGKPIGRDAREH